MIHVIGISHRLTPVHRREKVAVGQDALPVMLQRARERLQATECAILSTCNRTEIYFVSDSADDLRSAALDLLAGDAAAHGAIRDSEVYVSSGDAAATHLCEVAAGLDSLILGEHEILAQVKTSFQAARDAGCAGRLLTRLFDHAVRAGKRARAETRIASGVFTVGHCAARSAEGVLGDLCGKSLLVIGAGRIAEATSKHLAHKGAAPITVANRTLERAQEVAQRLGGRADTIANLSSLLASADLVITCTSAPHFILDVDAVERAVADRGDGRPLVIIDVSVPRDVEPLAGSVDGVCLFNLDDFEPVVAENAKAREGEVSAVRGIIAEEVHAFHEWLARSEVTPLIQNLRRHGESVKKQCVDEVRRKLSHLPTADLETVERLADLLVKRLLHAPTKALRAHPNGDPFTLAAAVQELFDLSADEAAQTMASGDACRGVAESHATARRDDHSSLPSARQHSVAGGRDHAHVESSPR